MKGSTRSDPKISELLMLGTVALVLLALVFAAPLNDMLRVATRQPEEGYILVVPAIAIYLGWLRRSRMNFVQIKPSYLGVVIVGLAVAISRIGYEFDVLIAWHVGLIIGFVGVVVGTFGLKMMLAYLPCIVLLLATLPVPGQVRQAVSIPLQEFAVSFTAILLEMLGIESVKSGSVIEIEGVSMAVGEACDGMRLLLPLGVVIYAFVFSLPLRPLVRFFLITSSVPVVLVCNVVRLVPTAMAYAYLPKAAPMIHDVGGWVSIPLAVGLLLMLLRGLPYLAVPVTRWRLALS